MFFFLFIFKSRQPGFQVPKIGKKTGLETLYPTPSEVWGRGETPRRPNSRATNGRSSAKDGTHRS